MDRVKRLKLILWIIVGLAAAVGTTRFIFGLGVTTNLNDITPWGLWIGFDVITGVALAAGGFVMTAIFYVMKREEFHPLVKPAVLTAFLGYMAVVVGLLFDLGLPWNIWHMIIFWNPHSPLFEVGWCVMLYSAVLLLEFSPVPLEEFSRYARIRNFLMKLRFPLVMLGIMLSTLHQSSLGSLFLIMPYKLHPLWYSNIIPVQFFISAVALGLLMVAFESLFSHWLYRRRPETNLVGKLGKIGVWILLIYLVVKLADIIVAGEFALIFDGSWESGLFITELAISTVFPIVIFSISRLRNNIKWQWAGAVMVVFGMVFNRLNVAGITMLRATGDSYFPSWMEITISLGVVSAAMLVFMLAIEKFHIWEKRPRFPEAEPEALPKFNFTRQVWLGNPEVAARAKYSLAFILSFAIGFALMPDDRIHSKGVEQITVRKACGSKILFIDGNRDSYGVKFMHQEHEKRMGVDSCRECHHISLPRSSEDGCWECHMNMYTPTDFFRHDWHASPTGARIACVDCHPQGEQRRVMTAKPCLDCHPNFTLHRNETGPVHYMAMSYADAMHKLCVSCHQIKAAELPDRPNLARCATCHETTLPEELGQNLKWEVSSPHFNRVILPAIDTARIKKVLQ